MTESVWGKNRFDIIVCVDSYENDMPVGFISSPFLDSPVAFCGVMQLLKKIDHLLGESKLPQAFSHGRRFSVAVRQQSSDKENGACDRANGLLATFSVRIIFRQNASWQGVITWLEKGREEAFRSVWELLQLMDSALSQNKE